MNPIADEGIHSRASVLVVLRQFTDIPRFPRLPREDIRNQHGEARRIGKWR